MNDDPRNRKVHRGIFYFHTRNGALRYARENNLPTDRIIEYQRGFAIQQRVSGPYWGPKGWD